MMTLDTSRQYRFQFRHRSLSASVTPFSFSFSGLFPFLGLSTFPLSFCLSIIFIHGLQSADGWMDGCWGIRMRSWSQWCRYLCVPCPAISIYVIGFWAARVGPTASASETPTRGSSGGRWRRHWATRCPETLLFAMYSDVCHHDWKLIFF